ncbi:hypothetical protein [Nocardia gipuzkoensis]|uniref:hypothetical protein n=1 Tax=Nocardia gipuzkoensis TaxID=2749991 RepID=UPI00237E68E3|nr:hypothetical protein [Nocardia gipuzkoensis]MDE1675203.1 hypothetical protein [Nocardia gipuzkoensis]
MTRLHRPMTPDPPIALGYIQVPLLVHPGRLTQLGERMRQRAESWGYHWGAEHIHPDLRRTCASGNAHSWYLDPTQDSPWQPITTALVSAVLVARSMGWCSWTLLDLDQLITLSTTGQL